MRVRRLATAAAVPSSTSVTTFLCSGFSASSIAIGVVG